MTWPASTFNVFLLIERLSFDKIKKEDFSGDHERWFLSDKGYLYLSSNVSVEFL